MFAVVGGVAPSVVASGAVLLLRKPLLFWRSTVPLACFSAALGLLSMLDAWFRAVPPKKKKTPHYNSSTSEFRKSACLNYGI